MNALGRKNRATVAGRPGIDLGRPLRFAHGVDHHGLDLERPIQGIEVGRFPEKLIQGFKIRRDSLLDKPAFRSFAITECPDHITEIAQLGIDGRNHGHNPKPPLTLGSQLDKLCAEFSRADRDRIGELLGICGYFRLRDYMRALSCQSSHPISAVEVRDVMLFDHDLRVLIMDCLEPLETCFRSTINEHIM